MKLLNFSSTLRINLSIIKSYWGLTDLFTWGFFVARVMALPLDKFHQILPMYGNVVDVGCGHGLVTQYLARRGPERNVIGYDPDERRIPIARKAGNSLENLSYQLIYFQGNQSLNLEGVVFNGVGCLLDDETCKKILKGIRASLKPGGTFLLSDIFKNDGNWRFDFHLWREHWFARMGFTKGQGLFVRSLSTWEVLVREAGFKQIESIHAPVPFHSVFNWVCK